MTYKERRSNGFLSEMDDEEVLRYTYKLHGKNITKVELKEIDSSLLNEIFKRRLRLENQLARRFLTDEEVIRYYTLRYKGLTRGDLCKEDPSFWAIMKNRCLIEIVPLNSRVKPKRYFSNMKDKEIIKYYKNNFSNLSRTELQRKNGGFYHNILKRGLIDIVPLANGYRGDSFFFNKSDKELIIFYKNNYNGKYRSQVEKLDGSFIHVMRDRGLISYIPLNPKRRNINFSKMSDKELIDFYHDNYKGLFIGQVQKKDASFYNLLRERGLVNHIPRKLKNNFSKMSDRQILSYYKSHYPGITRGKLAENNRYLYNNLTKRGLIKEIKTQRANRRPIGYLMKWANYKKELEKIIEENNGNFPTTRQFSKMNESSLYAASKYHGGKYAVMEKIGYNQKKEEELAGELEEILKEI